MHIAWYVNKAGAIEMCIQYTQSEPIIIQSMKEMFHQQGQI